MPAVMGGSYKSAGERMRQPNSVPEIDAHKQLLQSTSA